MVEDAPVNTGAADWPSEAWAFLTVRQMQTKLHRWATRDAGRRFDDLFNLVYDPAFLVVAWERVAANAGSKTPGIDRATVAWIESRIGVEVLLRDIRTQLKSRMFQPVAVRQVMIPKPNGKLRRLGIPTVTDRVVQAALKLVLEPIFEAGFQPCSYGFRPNRRAQDAVAEIHHFTTQRYHWVLEADIEACFDMIDHTALMGLIRQRISDKRVLGLVKAFLKAGVMTTTGDREETLTGTPQGGILSPAASQYRPIHPGRSFRRAVESDDGHGQPAGSTPLSRRGDLPSDPLRRRFRRRGQGRAAPRRAAARGGGRRLGPSGAAVVTGQDPGGPHRRRVRLPRLPHPPDAETRNNQVVRLHQAVEEGDRFDQGQGTDHDLQIQPAHAAGRPAAIPRPDAARVGELLPTRRVQSHFQRDRLLDMDQLRAGNEIRQGASGKSQDGLVAD
jgi:retron-type reverse transcriptase